MKNNIIPASVGLAVRKNGNDFEFLLTRRDAPGKPKWHNKWQLPGGGIEFGESPEEALVREFQEEISVTPRILLPQPFVRTTVWIGGDDDTTEDVQVILICYVVSIGDQVPRITCEETNDMGWFTLEQVRELDCLPNTKEFVEEVFQLIQDLRLKI